MSLHFDAVSSGLLICTINKPLISAWKGNPIEISDGRCGEVDVGRGPPRLFFVTIRNHGGAGAMENPSRGGPPEHGAPDGSLARKGSIMDHRELTLYMTPTRFDGLSGVFLARSLLGVLPDDPSPRLQAAAAEVRRTAEKIRLTLIRRKHEAPAEVRKHDLLAGDAWISVREGLESRSLLANTEVGERAAKLLTELFPDGTSFVRLPGPKEWSESDLLLQRIDDGGFASEIDDLLGPEHLTFLRATHEAYGRALGIGRDANMAPESDALRESLSELADAIAEYGRIMVGELERDDEASRARFRRSMGPLDAHRATLSASRAGEAPAVDEPDPDLDEPLPVVDPPSPVEA